MSFLEKLAGDPTERKHTSIIRNLEAVLNARRGYAGSVEVFGLGAYERHTSSKALVDALIAEMTEAIRKFEPRLKNAQVTLIGKDPMLWVRFGLVATCDQEPCRFAILFHSVFRNVRVFSESWGGAREGAA